MTKLMMVVNEDRFFLSHRKDIAVAAQQAGYDVLIVCKNTGQRQEVERLGLKMLELPINPTGTNVLQELHTFRFLYGLYRRHRPDIVHHVGLKNILWGGLAARMARVPGVVNAVSGLGALFNGEKPSLMTRLVMQGMRTANRRHGVSIIFQNQEDRELFLRHGICRENQCDFIKGSGVDLSEFRYTPDPGGIPVRIIFTARMVREKGTFTLCDAAELLRPEMEGRVEFLLCGRLSAGPRAIRKEELEARCDGHYIQWLGLRDDVSKLLRQSHIVAFPSYYREGVPRSLIEAAATGRPIVTTQSYGCKDTVDDGVNGFLVPVRDAKALADKLRLLINDADLRQRMGKAGREKAEKEFDIRNVVRRHLEIYQRLLTAKK